MADSFIELLHKREKRTQKLVDDVKGHLFRLKSHYDIATFCTTLSNQIFKDVIQVSVEDGASIMLQIGLEVIKALENLPLDFLLKSLQPLGLEKLWQRLISRLQEKEQYQKSSEYLNHLLDLLSQTQKNLQPKKPKLKNQKADEDRLKWELKPDNTDSKEFRKLVVTCYFLKIQAMYSIGSEEHLLSVWNVFDFHWKPWAFHLLKDDEQEAITHFDSMFRILYNVALKLEQKDKSKKEALVELRVKSLECLFHTQKPNLFFETALKMTTQQYGLEVNSRIMAQVRELIKDTTKSKSFLSEFLTWAIAYSSSALKASLFCTVKEISSLVKDNLEVSHKKSVSESQLYSLSLCVFNAQTLLSEFFSSGPNELQKTNSKELQQINLFLKSKILSEMTLGELPSKQKQSPTQATLPPIFTLLSKLAKSLEELRLFYVNNVYSGPSKKSTSTKVILRDDTLGELEDCFCWMGTVITKGLEWETQLTKLGILSSDIFSSLKIYLVDSLYTAAQLRLERSLEADSIDKSFQYLIQIPNIVKKFSIKEEVTVGRFYTSGTLLYQLGHFEKALYFLSKACEITERLAIEPTVPLSSQYLVIYFCKHSCNDHVGALQAIENAIVTSKELQENTPSTLFEHYIFIVSKLHSLDKKVESKLPPLLDKIKPPLSLNRKGEILGDALQIFQSQRTPNFEPQLHIINYLLSELYTISEISEKEVQSTSSSKATLILNRARVLVERSKLNRVYNPPEFHRKQALEDCKEAVNLLTKIQKFNPKNGNLLDELGKAHAWQGICEVEMNQDFLGTSLKNGLANFEGNMNEKRMKTLLDSLNFWEKIVDILEVPSSSDESTREQNKSNFFSLEVTLNTLRLLGDIFLFWEDMCTYINIYKLILRFIICCISPSVKNFLTEIIDAYSSLGLAYYQLGYVQKAKLFLKKADSLKPSSLSPRSSVGKSYQKCKLASIYCSIDTNTKDSDTTYLNKLYESLKAEQNGGNTQEDFFNFSAIKLALSHLSLECGLLTNALKEAKEATDLITCLLPTDVLEYSRKKGDSPRSREGENALNLSSSPSTQIASSPSFLSATHLSKWAIMKGFIDCMLQMGSVYEMRGQPQEANLFYSKGLRVGEISGSSMIVARFQLELGELEYHRNHPVESKIRLNCAIEFLKQKREVEHKIFGQDILLKVSQKNPPKAKKTKATSSKTIKPKPKSSKGKAKQESDSESEIMIEEEAEQKNETMVDFSKSVVGVQLEVLANLRLGDLFRRQKLWEESLSVYLTAQNLLTELVGKKPNLISLRCLDSTPKEGRLAKSKSTTTTIATTMATTNKKGTDVDSILKKDQWLIQELENTSETNFDSEEGFVFRFGSLFARIAGRFARVEFGKGKLNSAHDLLKKAIKSYDCTPLTRAVLLYHLALVDISKLPDQVLIEVWSGRGATKTPHSSVDKIYRRLTEASQLSMRFCVGKLSKNISMALALVNGTADPSLTSSFLNDTIGLSARHQMSSILRYRLHTMDSSPDTKKSQQSNKKSLESERDELLHLQNLFDNNWKAETGDDFAKKMVDELPKEWTICSIGVADHGRNILISRMRPGQASPLITKIPIFYNKKLVKIDEDFDDLLDLEFGFKSDTESRSDEDSIIEGVKKMSLKEKEPKQKKKVVKKAEKMFEEEEVLDKSDIGDRLSDLQRRFVRIMEASKQTTMQVANTIEERKEWWRARQRLDDAMKRLTILMEEWLLCEYKGVLMGPLENHEANSLAQEMVQKIEEKIVSMFSSPVQGNEGEKASSSRGRGKKVTKVELNNLTISPQQHSLFEQTFLSIPFLEREQIEQGFSNIINLENPAFISEITSFAITLYVEFVNHFKPKKQSKPKPKPKPKSRKYISSDEESDSDDEDNVIKTDSSELSESEIKKVLEYVRNEAQDLLWLKRGPVILILDKNVQGLPWESIPILEQHPISRVTSLLMLQSLALKKQNTSSPNFLRDGINPHKGYFLLNPDGNLNKTQDRLEGVFHSFGWKGLTCEKPSPEKFTELLSENEIFVYCGHGNGEQYCRGELIQRLQKCAVTFLMGCSSGSLTDEGNFDPMGVVISYQIARCPAVLGNLWDVTDGDMDKLTENLLKLWLVEGSNDLISVLPLARKVCQFRYLIGAATVYYGIPVFVNKKLVSAHTSNPHPLPSISTPSITTLKQKLEKSEIESTPIQKTIASKPKTTTTTTTSKR